MKNKADREYYTKRLSGMDTERSSFMSQWRELSDFVRPKRGVFETTDRNKGDKRSFNIINSVATKALRVGVSGMMSGTISPTRPWFDLETMHPALMESSEVKAYLWKVGLILRQILAQSNFYSQASVFLEEVLLFGTSMMTHEDDFEDVARFKTHSVGSYFMASDYKGEVNTFAKKFQKTADQLVEEFGYDNVSHGVRQAVDVGGGEKWFDCVHMIEPNEGHLPSSPMARDLPWKSVYYEPGNREENDFLIQGGFHEKPFYSLRWNLTGEDVYGTDCPGMEALSDIRQLQIQEKRKAQAIEKMVNPPLHGPATLRNVPVSSLPGGLNIYDYQAGSNKLEPIYQVNPQLGDMRVDMDAVERRIKASFFNDLFFAITDMEGIQPRNQLDLMQRNEERLLQLGPVLERLHGEWLDPLIDRLFNQAIRANILPEPPEVLQGKSLSPRYISSLAMAQRQVATGSIERLAGYVGNLAQAGFQAAVDKFDADQSIDEMARAIGAPPTLVVPDEVVKNRRAKRAKQQEEAQAMEQIQGAADAANKVAGAKVGGEESSVLEELVK